MQLEPIKDYAAMSSVGASILFEEAMRKIAKGERFNLGLATGNTMITLYDELAAKFNAAGADLSLLSTWNLDEYSLDGRAAVPHDHPLSYWKYMHERLFSNTRGSSRSSTPRAVSARRTRTSRIPPRPRPTIPRLRRRTA